MKVVLSVCFLSVFGVCFVKALPIDHHSSHDGSLNQLPAPILEQVCKDLTPVHGPNKPLDSEFPYRIITDVKEVKPFDKVKVTISGINGATFRGFVAQARNGDKVYGKFEKEENLGFLNCFGEEENTVTTRVHANKIDMNEISFTWTAPEELPEYIEFVVTVVKDFTNFWVLQKSEKVKAIKQN